MKGKSKSKCRISAKVIRKDGKVEDYGVIAGPPFLVWFSKIKRSVKTWLQLLKSQLRAGG